MSVLILILAVLIGLGGLLMVLVRPIAGLFLILMINPFDQLINSVIDMPAAVTLGRALGILVFIGWLSRFLVLRKSNAASLKGFNVIPLLMIFSMTISTLSSPYPGLSFDGSLKISILIMMLLFIQDFIKNEKQLRMMIAVIAFTGGVGSLVGLIQFLGYKGYIGLIGTVSNFAGEGVRFAGFDANPNGYGIQLMSGIPLLVFLTIESRSRSLRYVSAFFLITSVASLYLTMSRTHFFGLLIFVGLVVFAKVKNRQITSKQVWSIVGMILLSTFIFLKMPGFVGERLVRSTFSGADTSEQARGEIILKGLQILEDNPLFGAGFYSSSEIDINRFSNIRGYNGHDMVSLYVAGTGLVGATLFVLLCLLSYRYLNDALKYYEGTPDKYLFNFTIILRAAFLALLATSLANPIVFQRIFWVYVALSAVLYRWSVLERNAVRKKEVLPGNAWRRRAYLQR
jgi:O-Antigen ligase